MKTGLIYSEPSLDYHSTDAVSSSKLADMRVAGELCPRNYFLRHVAKTVEHKKGAHFNIGIASHLAILEGPAAFDAGCVMEPETYWSTPEPTKKDPNPAAVEKPWNNNATVCRQWYAGCAGKIVLDKSELKLIEAMRDAIAEHPIARQLTSEGDAEVTFRQVFGNLTLQCRVDKWHALGSPAVGPVGVPLVVDLKTCDTLEQFEREFYFLRYNFRAEFYRLVVSEVLAKAAGVPVADVVAPTYAFVVVEKSVPHRVKVYLPDAESLEAGRREVQADLMTLRACMKAGEWPAAPLRVQSIGLKTWQIAKSDAANEAALAAV